MSSRHDARSSGKEQALLWWQQCRAGPESPPSNAPGQAAEDTPPHGGSCAGPGIPSSVLSARREARTLDTGGGDANTGSSCCQGSRAALGRTSLFLHVRTVQTALGLTPGPCVSVSPRNQRV